MLALVSSRRIRVLSSTLWMSEKVIERWCVRKNRDSSSTNSAAVSMRRDLRESKTKKIINQPPKRPTTTTQAQKKPTCWTDLLKPLLKSSCPTTIVNAGPISTPTYAAISFKERLTSREFLVCNTAIEFTVPPAGKNGLIFDHSSGRYSYAIVLKAFRMQSVATVLRRCGRKNERPLLFGLFLFLFYFLRLFLLLFCGLFLLSRFFTFGRLRFFSSLFGLRFAVECG